jgi:hypothetical protein
MPHTLNSVHLATEWSRNDNFRVVLTRVHPDFQCGLYSSIIRFFCKVIRGRLFVFSSFVVRPLHCLVHRFVQLIAASKEATESRVPLSKVEVITVLRSLPWLGWQLWNICVTHDHGYVPLVVSSSRSFPHSRPITRFVTRLTRRIPLVEEELLLTLPEHLSSPPDFSGVRVTRSLLLYVCFVDRYLSFLYFFFWPLCCLSFDLRILIIPLVSSNSSCTGILKLFSVCKSINVQLECETAMWGQNWHKQIADVLNVINCVNLSSKIYMFVNRMIINTGLRLNIYY